VTKILAALLFAASMLVMPASGLTQDSQTPASAQPQPSGVYSEPATALPEPAGAVQEPEGAVLEPAATQPQAMQPIADTPAEETAGSAVDLGLPHDLSPWGMFMGADIVVKAVMIGLAFASLVTWTVWLAKSLELAAAKMRAQRALRRIVEAHSLVELAPAMAKQSDPAALMAQAARHEVELSTDALDYAKGEGLKERVASHLSRIEAQAGRRMARSRFNTSISSP
jgi:biopolymer transport protein ExbB